MSAPVTPSAARNLEACPPKSIVALRATCALLLLLTLLTACRREHPAIARAAAASTATSIAVAALPTVTPTPLVPVVAAPIKPAAGARRAKIAGGNLGVASSGIGAGIQIWSKPGGVMAGGSTMAGTVSDGASVDVVAEEQFLGQRYFQVRGGGSEGWIEARFVQLEAG